MAYRIAKNNYQPASGGLQSLPGQITLTDEPCCVSLDDDPKEKRAKMPCGCAISVGAVDELCTHTLDAGKSRFDCPGCGVEWDFHLVRHVLSATKSRPEIDRIAGRLNACYLNDHAVDSRQCPTCQTHCVRDSNADWQGNRNRVVCTVCSVRAAGGSVEFCWLCGHAWISGVDESCGNPFCGKASDAASRQKALSECGTTTLTGGISCYARRACPECGELIEHTEGCKHMRCNECGVEFCFVCLKMKNPTEDWACGGPFDRCQLAPVQRVSAPSLASTGADADDGRRHRGRWRRMRKRCSVM